MERSAQTQLELWFRSKNRKPLVLRGARQVGKTTLVRQFAKAAGLTLFEVNLERQLYLRDVFASNKTGPILGELAGLCGEIRDRSSSLLFLNEVQAVPEALASLRYFLEDLPELAVVAAGSLLEFTLADHKFSMPVGRINFLHLGPLSFEEFLMATDPELHQFYSGWKLEGDLPDSRHQKLLQKQREFLIVGGMPRAVQTWLETSAFSEVANVQRAILDTSMDDFARYARPAQLARLQRIFRAVPMYLGRKVKFTSLSPEDRSAEVKAAIDLLCKARVCAYVYHSDCSGIPLEAGQVTSVYKLLYLDIGLVSLTRGVTWPQAQSLDNRRLLNEGPLAEQFVGQELLNRFLGKQLPELNYWLRAGRSNNSELDFVIALGNEILPIEVKAGKMGSLKSLQQYMSAKKPARAVRFDLSLPTVQQLTFEGTTTKLISLPLYFAGRVLDLLS